MSLSSLVSLGPCSTAVSNSLISPQCICVCIYSPIFLLFECVLIYSFAFLSVSVKCGYFEGFFLCLWTLVFHQIKGCFFSLFLCPWVLCLHHSCQTSWQTKCCACSKESHNMFDKTRWGKKSSHKHLVADDFQLRDSNDWFPITDRSATLLTGYFKDEHIF